MEKIPGLRIVGDASGEAKEQAKEMMGSRLADNIHSLSEQDQEYIAGHEYPKTEQELALIYFANSETNKLLEEAGMKPYDVPAENYHLLSNESFMEIINNEKSEASVFLIYQCILFNAELVRKNSVNLGSAFLHETLHLKGHLAMEVEESEEGINTMITYREGVTVRAAQKKESQDEDHSHFVGLHEAIVTEQEKRSLPNLLSLPTLKKEKEKLSSEEMKAWLEEVSEITGTPKGDFIWVDEDKYITTFPYRSQREALQYVCEEIQKQFPEKYQSADEVFKEFLKAQFTGRLLPIARLVDGTFGEGSFRRLGDMETDNESGVLTLEEMKRSRIKNKK